MTILTISICFLYITNASAAAWVQGQGNGQAILTLNAYQSLNSYLPTGSRTNSGHIFSKYEFNPFIEYGINDKTTIGANPAVQYWQSLDTKTSKKTSGGLFGSELFVRRKIWEGGNTVFSIQPLIQTPYLISSGSGTTIDMNSYEAEIRALIGYAFQFDKKIPDGKFRPFSGQYHFVDLETAYRKRGGSGTDVVKIDGTAGFRFNESILLLGQFFSDIGVRKENKTIRNDHINRYGNVKLQLSGAVQTSKTTSVQLGVYAGVYTEVTENRYRDYQGVVLSLWKGF